MKNSILICSILLLLSGCEKDDYNKNEFRYLADGVRVSTPDEGFRGLGKYPPAYMQWTDSAKTGFEIYSNIRQGDKFYKLHITIDSLRGTGIYKFPEVRAYIMLSGMNATYYSAYSRLDLKGELNLNYLNPLNGAAGYFHFLCEDTVRNVRVPVTNGRFNLGWFRP